MKKLFAKNILATLALVVFFSFTACENVDPESHLQPEEKDIFITNYDTMATFGQYQTFSIVDSIELVSDDLLSVRSRSDEAVAVLDAITYLMKLRGFTQVAMSENPDIGIDVSSIILTDTGIGQVNIGNNYWGYPGYSNYYPSYYYRYQVNTGALRLEMVDLKNRLTPQSKLKIIWNGYVVSAAGSNLPPLNRIIAGIQNLFEQSPYLQYNQNID